MVVCRSIGAVVFFVVAMLCLVRRRWSSSS
jgi:hypothetical protein